MLECLSSSISRSLESLPHNALVINSSGVILFANSTWNAYRQEYGISPLKDWVGADYKKVMQALSILPDQWDKLYDSIQYISRGDDLTVSSEFFIHTANKGDRVFRLNAFPLISDNPIARHTLVISHYDVGPISEGCHVHPSSSHKRPNELVPICASCKSIRNNQEKWLIIEHYLKQQHSLHFTHDICPDCIRMLYPKYAGALKN